jgi:hypothetical protein
MTKWVATGDGGAVNSAFIIRVTRHPDGGSTLHLTDGSIVRSSLLYEVVAGDLVEVEPDDDDEDDCPF